jgi:hypothetical protein
MAGLPSTVDPDLPRHRRCDIGKHSNIIRSQSSETGPQTDAAEKANGQRGPKAQQ